MTTTITAAVQRQIGAAPQIETLTIDDPRAGEVLVRLVGVGVCHTDMVMRDGHLPIPQPVVLGHEGSGYVEKVGAGVTGLEQGDPVVLSFDSCGHCPSCQDDDPAYCHSWFPLNFGGGRGDGSTALADGDGKAVHSHIFGQSSFASHAIVHARNTVKVAADVPLELLGPLGCGIQTGAGSVLNVLRPRPGSSLAVIGTGAVGLSAIMAAKIAGCTTIIALDINMARVALALELGATHGFKADAASVADHAQSAGLAAGLDYIIDTTGIPAVCDAAIAALGPRGELALVGAYPPGMTDFLNSRGLSREETVAAIVAMTDGGADYTFDATGNTEVMRTALEACHRGWGTSIIIGVAEAGKEISTRPFQLVTGRNWRGTAFGGAKGRTDVPKIVDMYMTGKIQIDPMITHVMGLEEINTAFDLMHAGTSIRSVVVF